MAHDFNKRCQSRTACQLRVPIAAADRVPIISLARPEVPFQTVLVSSIRPLKQSSCGHKFGLFIIDVRIKWPEVICLKSQTAKVTCNALVEVFARLAMLGTICSDMGTNFASQLTKLLLEKMGVTPRLSIPDHLKAAG